jgi:hypothetical protein
MGSELCGPSGAVKEIIMALRKYTHITTNKMDHCDNLARQQNCTTFAHKKYGYGGTNLAKKYCHL